jgi:phage pi2 protein 07
MNAKNFNLAARIWKVVFEELYNRNEFDWWWDGIDPTTKTSIRSSIVSRIEKELEKPRRPK